MARAQRSSLTHSFCQDFSQAGGDISGIKSVLKALKTHNRQIILQGRSSFFYRHFKLFFICLSWSFEVVFDTLQSLTIFADLPRKETVWAFTCTQGLTENRIKGSHWVILSQEDVYFWLIQFWLLNNFVIFIVLTPFIDPQNRDARIV